MIFDSNRWRGLPKRETPSSASRWQKPKRALLSVKSLNFRKDSSCFGEERSKDQAPIPWAVLISERIFSGSGVEAWTEKMARGTFLPSRRVIGKGIIPTILLFFVSLLKSELIRGEDRFNRGEGPFLVHLRRRVLKIMNR